VSASRRWDGGGGSLIMYIVSKKRKKEKNFGRRPCPSPRHLVLDACRIGVFVMRDGCYREGWWCVMRWRGVMTAGCDEHHGGTSGGLVSQQWRRRQCGGGASGGGPLE